MKKYLHYLFKKTLLETLVITLVSTLVYVLYILISEPGSLSSPPYETFVLPYVFVFSVVAAFIIATALPILRLHSFKNRSQIDMYYAFPIERKKLLLSHIIISLLQIVIIFTCMFFIGMIVFLMLRTNSYKVLYFVLMYLVNLLSLISYMTIISFIFIKANSLFDGIMFVVGWMLILLLASVLIYTRIYDDFGNFLYLLTPFYAVDILNSNIIHLSRVIEGIGVGPQYIFYEQVWIAIIHLISYLGIASAIFVYHIFRKTEDKAENIGSISNHPIGYILLIPLMILILSVTIIDGYLDAMYIILLLFVVIVAYVLYIVFRRTIKLEKFDYMAMVGSVFLGALIGFFIH